MFKFLSKKLTLENKMALIVTVWSLTLLKNGGVVIAFVVFRSKLRMGRLWMQDSRRLAVGQPLHPALWLLNG